jgi:hypothetical protein
MREAIATQDMDAIWKSHGPGRHSKTPAALLTVRLRRREGREGLLAVDGPSS